MEIINKEKIFGKLSECIFGIKTVGFLVQIISEKGIEVEPHKIHFLRDWTNPRTKIEVQSFLGLVNYFRRFIRNCSKFSKRLTELTKKVPFKWSRGHYIALGNLKSAISSAPILRSFNAGLPVMVTIDALNHAIGALLEQMDGKNRDL